MAPHDHHPLPWLRCHHYRKESDLMPRRNSIGYSRRRTTRRPEPEPVDRPVNFEALANKLVRHGLASPAILTGYPPKLKEIPHG